MNECQNIKQSDSNSKNSNSLSIIIDYYQNIEQKRIFCVIDLDYTIVAINEQTIDIFGLSGEVVGKNFLHDFERSDNRYKFVSANLFDCVSNKVIVKFLTANKSRKSGYETLLYEYIPLIDKVKKTVVAILISAELPSIPLNFHKLKETLKGNKPKIDIMIDKLVLSEREKEISFLLFHCRTRDEIAQILSNIYDKSITESSVRKIIQRNLYDRYNVVNDIDLRNAIRDTGLHLRIPDAISEDFIFTLNDL
jgi:hypothetical protein